MKKKILIIIASIIVFAGALTVFIGYRWAFSPNIKIATQSSFLYIPSNSDFEDVVNILEDNGILKNKSSFIHCAQWMKYPEKIKAGKYKIQNHMNNLDLLRMLIAGNQTPVNLKFNNIRLKEQLAARIGKQIEADSTILLDLLNNDDFMQTYDLRAETALTLFIPNTYQFFWNTSSEEFIKRMKTEYDNFWTPERLAAAETIPLSPTEVSILASIVEQETNKNDEKQNIASVYINRLHKGILLQADPTVKFAVGDFSIKRVTGKHLAVDSPYNTYRYNGLPPGPICMPSIASIDAVLYHAKTNYLFFCAKADFSGYHVFTSSDVEHMANARKFQSEMNRRGIH